MKSDCFWWTWVARFSRACRDWGTDLRPGVGFVFDNWIDSVFKGDWDEFDLFDILFEGFAGINLTAGFGEIDLTLVFLCGTTFCLDGRFGSLVKFFGFGSLVVVELADLEENLIELDFAEGNIWVIARIPSTFRGPEY